MAATENARTTVASPWIGAAALLMFPLLGLDWGGTLGGLLGVVALVIGIRETRSNATAGSVFGIVAGVVSIAGTIGVLALFTWAQMA